ncbi:MAG TPA: hypothetical protein PLJ34_07170 [Hyphomicrobiales bacterium]|nr:hypothetical protein [Hyphomicrobiales bacterium]
MPAADRRLVRLARMWSELPPAARRRAEAAVTQIYDASRPAPRPVSLGPVGLAPQRARKERTMATITLTEAQKTALWLAVKRGLFKVTGGYRARGHAPKIAGDTIMALARAGLVELGNLRGRFAAVPTYAGRRLLEEIG